MATVSHSTGEGAAPWQTHEVFNQVPPLEGIDVFSSNRPLVEATEREGAGWVTERASALGRFVGGAPQREWGRQANENKPVLHTFDRYGHRIDEVEFHPAWHELMTMGVEHELHSLPWTSTEPYPHTARAALYMTAMQAEAGFACPITMTFAVVPALRTQPELAAEWEPLVTATHYDPRLVPAAEKGSAISGMAMTEKQGGSDVRANTTFARPLNGGGAGAEYEIVGHKWFCSAPMSDVFLVLAQTDDGLSCFLLPRILPDGTRNAFHIQRLKDKLGNHSNASSEVEFHGAWARMVGEPGRGVPTIIEMVGHTRLDCVIGSAAGMRSGVVGATHHTAHRSAFGKLLSDQPLMRNVLADLCVESEATTALAMRLARAYDEAREDADAGEDTSDAQLFKRLATAVGKYWTCKRAPNHAFESLECLGGAGYVEESGMPRLYREAPLASIWEGSGNVMSLDVLRALTRTPRSLEVFLAEVELAAGGDARLDRRVSELKDQFSDPETLESRARRVVEGMALCLQGSLLVRHGDPAVADAFCASRLGGDGGLEYGTLPAGVDFEAIVSRSRPEL
ncbi:MAG: putative acyl-CoA dehydrogenase [Solirubrobacteraceae bacterium]|jgi:putative acyl-CoA dehydrogenase|nr:acyl-CoA dehydrogenase [Solirubrobacterales bacterium]MEA2217189.1 putative acyl-CoA dehydrogenase [Solirubrobacteraceae bacterium]